MRPSDFPTFAPAKKVEAYLQSYAKHFDLYPHIEFSKEVISIDRDHSTGKWVVITKDAKSGVEESRTFSRVVVATGILNVPNMPKVKGMEKFEGEVVHSRQFKNPSKYAGKNVLVVGIGATGADTLSFLKKAGTGKVYLSHRGQYFLVSLITIDTWRTGSNLGIATTMARWESIRPPNEPEGSHDYAYRQYLCATGMCHAHEQHDGRRAQEGIPLAISTSIVPGSTTQ